MAGMGKVNDFYQGIIKEYGLEIADEFKRGYQVDDQNFRHVSAISTLDRILLGKEKPRFISFGKMNSLPIEGRLIFGN